MYPSYEPWKIVREIGSGSFGKVYEIERRDAFDVYKAALKVISIPADKGEIDTVRSNGMTDESVSEYFQSEAEEIVKEIKMMARFKGITNIVSYEDHLVKRHEDGIGWDIMIRMELLTSLTKYLTENAITRQEIIRLGIDICNALDRCQKDNIIHRDIKPDNIFVSRQGDYKLGDFGIARTAEKTLSGMSQKGTPLYMAPEVYKGEAYGHTVDIYSLGIVMYRLLNNNRIPFLPPYPQSIKYKDQQLAMVKRMSGDPFPMPSGDNGRLAEIVLKASSYLPKDRYSSPARMREELQEILLTEKEVKEVPMEQPLVIPIEKNLPSSSSVKRIETVNTQELANSQDVYQEEDSKTISASSAFGISSLSEEESVEEAQETEPEIKPDISEEPKPDLEQETPVDRGFHQGEEYEILECIPDGLMLYERQDVVDFEEEQDLPDEKEIESEAEPGFPDLEETVLESDKDQSIDEGDEINPDTAPDITNEDSKEQRSLEEASILEEADLFDATENQELIYAENKNHIDDYTEQKKQVQKLQEKKGKGVLIGAVAAAAVVFAILLTIWKPWAKTVMPELVGKTVEEVENTKIAKRDISYTEEWSDKIEAGIIISQTPIEGVELEKDQKIELVVSKGKEQISLSKLVDKDYSEIQKSDLAKKLSVSVKEEYNDTIEQGHIVSQNPASGTTVFKGDKLELIVSKGREPVEVADYTGRAYKEIKEEAEKSGLTVKVQKKYNDTYEKGVVFKTKPASGKTAYKGDTLTIYVSKGVEMVEVPSLVGISSAEADKKLAEAGLVKGQVINEYSNSVGYGVVISQGVEAGMKIKKGDLVQYNISIGAKPKTSSSGGTGYSSSASSGGSRKKRSSSKKKSKKPTPAD